VILQTEWQRKIKAMKMQNFQRKQSGMKSNTIHRKHAYMLLASELRAPTEFHSKGHATTGSGISKLTETEN
jgi:hypothetical protein